MFSDSRMANSKMYLSMRLAEAILYRMNKERAKSMSSDTDIYKHQNFGNALGMGKKTALLIVDFVNGFDDPNLFGGGNISEACDNTIQLLSKCRQKQVPVAHTRVVFAEDGSDDNIMSIKVPALKVLTEEAACSQIVDRLAPQSGEIIIRKRVPSAFFGTDLAANFAKRRIDTILIAGCTTSGCVRASALDAMCHGFRPIIITDCVGDRAHGPHEANLFDLKQKYAELQTRKQILKTLELDENQAAE